MHMKPMVCWTFVVTENVEGLAWEFFLESWVHVVERQGVSTQVNPSGEASEVGPSSARPEAIG